MDKVESSLMRRVRVLSKADLANPDDAQSELLENIE